MINTKNWVNIGKKRIGGGLKDGLLCFRVKLIRIGIIGKRRIEGGLKDERMADSVLELNLIGNGIIGSWKDKKIRIGKYN